MLITYQLKPPITSIKPKLCCPSSLVSPGLSRNLRASSSAFPWRHQKSWTLSAKAILQRRRGCQFCRKPLPFWPVFPIKMQHAGFHHFWRGPAKTAKCSIRKSMFNSFSQFSQFSIKGVRIFHLFPIIKCHSLVDEKLPNYHIVNISQRVPHCYHCWL